MSGAHYPDVNIHVNVIALNGGKPVLSLSKVAILTHISGEL